MLFQQVDLSRLYVFLHKYSYYKFFSQSLEKYKIIPCSILPSIARIKSSFNIRRDRKPIFLPSPSRSRVFKPYNS